MTKRKFHRYADILRHTRIDRRLWLFTGNLFRRMSGRYRYDSDAVMPYPTTLMLELTNRCNLRCVICPRQYDYGKKLVMGDMDMDLRRKIIDETYPYLQSVGLTGMGETLLARNLVDTARYIKALKKSIIIFISTNANIPSFIDLVTPVLPWIDTVQISIDGVGDLYESMRPGSSFGMLCDNINGLVPLAACHDVDIMFNMVVTELNYHHMLSVLELAHDMGVRYVNYNCFNLASVTDIDTDYYDFYSSDRFLEKLNEIRKTAGSYKDIEVTGLDAFSQVGKISCPLLYNHFQINYDGEVPPCCSKPFSKEYSFGNVTGSSVKDVLNSPRARAFRHAWFTGTPHRFCHKCNFLRGRHIYDTSERTIPS